MTYYIFIHSKSVNMRWLLWSRMKKQSDALLYTGTIGNRKIEGNVSM